MFRRPLGVTVLGIGVAAAAMAYLSLTALLQPYSGVASDMRVPEFFFAILAIGMWVIVRLAS